MGVQRDRVAAFKAALAATGATEFRMPMATPDAVALAGELLTDDVTPRFAHTAHVSAALAAELASAAPEEGDFEGQLARADRIKRAAATFWDAFEGESVDGVEIIRRR